MDNKVFTNDRKKVFKNNKMDSKKVKLFSNDKKRIKNSQII